ncbi:MAG: DUF1294 domain-containing protein [Erysipelotrichales bacterium]|nr:DUF1294 domain-containing protein [Erysipelotrichales bacterium]
MLRYYFLAINILSFLLYGIDKLNSKFGEGRIPERILLRVSLFGGVYGSILGMLIFHHKTRKRIFKKVNVICFIAYTIFLYSMWRYL